MGFQACEHAFAEEDFQNGNYGAGTGATVGKSAGLSCAMKGGLGSCLFQYDDDLLVGAVAAVNCVGDVIDTRTGETLAGAFRDHQFLSSTDYMLQHYAVEKDLFSSNTVIGALVTNARLNKNQATKLAGIGQDSIARAISPAHSIFDGDTVFAMSCGDVYANLDAVGVLASKAMEAAIANSIVTAKSAYGYRSYHEIQKNTESCRFRNRPVFLPTR
jgi:L-aminopeptidase/D-esterase-like protein